MEDIESGSDVGVAEDMDSVEALDDGSWHGGSTSTESSEDALARELEQAELAELKETVPRTDQGTLTSIGSTGHPETCSPCVFAFLAVGCSKGFKCEFCHFRHENAKMVKGHVFLSRQKQACANWTMDLEALETRDNCSMSTETHGSTSTESPEDALARELEQAELAELKETVPRTDQGTPTSNGSTGHPETCSPCIFAFSAVGCSKGFKCEFCHFRHENTKTLKVRSGSLPVKRQQS
eukprot:TRINITY_DN10154_c0_g1_i1.p1 TRINITY_DN10154_c0_g1~~TRINITY_DN10154_c0_g1_i1.p1  ORF type:complete len:238 (+),score=37.34 TRINITY_DN10154_c0_g1_i1:59-772(+)